MPASVLSRAAAAAALRRAAWPPKHLPKASLLPKENRVPSMLFLASPATHIEAYDVGWALCSAEGRDGSLRGPSLRADDTLPRTVVMAEEGMHTELKGRGGWRICVAEHGGGSWCAPSSLAGTLAIAARDASPSSSRAESEVTGSVVWAEWIEANLKESNLLNLLGYKVDWSVHTAPSAACGSRCGLSPLSRTFGIMARSNATSSLSSPLCKAAGAHTLLRTKPVARLPFVLTSGRRLSNWAWTPWQPKWPTEPPAPTLGIDDVVKFIQALKASSEDEAKLKKVFFDKFYAGQLDDLTIVNQKLDGKADETTRILKEIKGDKKWGTFVLFGKKVDVSSLIAAFLGLFGGGM